MIELIKSNDEIKQSEIGTEMVVVFFQCMPFLRIYQRFNFKDISNQYIFHPLSAIHFRLISVPLEDNSPLSDIIELWETGDKEDNKTETYVFPHDEFLSILNGEKHATTT